MEEGVVCPVTREDGRQPKTKKGTIDGSNTEELKIHKFFNESVEKRSVVSGFNRLVRWSPGQEFGGESRGGRRVTRGRKVVAFYTVGSNLSSEVYTKLTVS